MICSECQQACQTSTITELGCSKTMLYYPPFFDEQGKRHHHDGNYRTTGYRCSNGHTWSTKIRAQCWCGWPKTVATDQDTIYIGGGR